MALQGSGAISLSEVEAEFGGSSPTSLSEYYRGGSYVSGSEASEGTWSSYEWHATNYYWFENDGNFGEVHWGGTGNIPVAGQSGTGYGIDTTNGYRYQRGDLESTSGGSSGSPTLSFYQVRRQTYTTNDNNWIPTSGAISLKDFYNGDN